MAKIKFGMMMTDARGKLGGQVFSKNRSGAYVRTKVTPVNPRSISQQANRSLLGSLSSLWSGLTDVQRNAWNGSVETWQKTNVFGDLQKPTGKNLFTSLNKVRKALFPALELQELPPIKIELPVVIVRTGDYDSSTSDFSLNIERPEEGTVNVRVRATGIVSPGTTYVKNLLRQIGTSFTVVYNTPLFISAAYGAVFGLLPVGAVVYVEVTPVASNGQLGVPSIIRVTAAA